MKTISTITKIILSAFLLFALVFSFDYNYVFAEDTIELQTVTVKLSLTDSNTKKTIDDETSFDIYTESDGDYKESLGAIYVEEGTGSAELLLEPGNYYLVQSYHVNGYHNTKVKKITIEKGQEEISVALSSEPIEVSEENKDDTQVDVTDGEEEDKTNPAGFYDKISVSIEWNTAEIVSYIDVQLYADGDLVDTTTLSDDDVENPWSDRFIGPYPKKNEHAKETNYMVEINEITGYRIEVTGNAEDGFVISVSKEEIEKSNETKRTEEQTTEESAKEENEIADITAMDRLASVKDIIGWKKK